MNKKLILWFIFNLCACPHLFSQFSIDLILGTKVSTDANDGASSTSAPKVITSLQTGVELNHKKLPLVSLSYQRSFWKKFTSYAGPSLQVVESLGTIQELWEEDQIHIYFNLDKYRVGIGHFWRKRENNLNFIFVGPLDQKSRGLQASFSVPTNWIDIEFRTKAQYHPYFAALVGSSHYTLLLTKRIGIKKHGYKKFSKLQLNGIVGFRSFLIDIDLLPGEVLNKPIAFAPLLGLEFYFPRFKTSINLEKDWWNSFNGGSTVRPVKGLVYSSYIGFMYHHKLKNNRKLRFGIGASWIEDNESKLKLITANPTPEQQKLVNFQVKGIGIKVSYEIIPNIDLELKTTIPLIGEEIFESPSRTSLGLIYRYNPDSEN